MNINNYGIYTFNEKIMKERLPKSIFQSYKESLRKRIPLTKECASAIANEMKLWALENNVTHYTHWFSPLNNKSAEKHEAFLTLDNDTPIYEFSGKELRKGEADASSFPSGGLRETFEARGYTSWDCTSFSFIKNNSLYIPTLFLSYNGEALDNKTPLLKSCDALNTYSTKLLKLLGIEDVSEVNSYVGSEQEYFLINEKDYEKRIDIKLTGKTIFGTMPHKNIDSHYYGNINETVMKFMQEVDETLWKYGIPAKTKHNEAAPCQYELACIYRKVNITTDNNQLVMQVLQDVAKKYNLRCLLHEKPFEGINGSGKHNNWSIITNTGLNLFSMGKDPLNNIAFLATLACFVKGVDEYSDLLRLSIASYSNDYRLGGNEAPPSIMSIYLGSELTNLIDSIINDKNLDISKKRFDTGVSIISDFSKDSADRNRTSPFSYNGNKFEFRGVGSFQSIAFVNTILNTIMAYEMKEMIKDINNGLSPLQIVKEYFKNHKRIIYDGDCYSSFWVNKAKLLGLSNKQSTLEALSTLKDEKQIKIFKELKIYNQAEIDSRYKIMFDKYFNDLILEVKVAIKMVDNLIYPNCIKYLNHMSSSLKTIMELNIVNRSLHNKTFNLSILIDKLSAKINTLKKYLNKLEKVNKYSYENAIIVKDNTLLSLKELKDVVNELENNVAKQYWPIPSYEDMLFDI